MSAQTEREQLFEAYYNEPRRSKRVELLFGFEPTDYQAELLDRERSGGRVEAAVKPGRQVGKTLTGAIIAADAVYQYPGEDILITAPFQETADEMFRETKNYFRQGPLTLKEYGVTKDNEQTWEFSHNGRILSRTLGQLSDESPGQRGKNPVVVIVDEAHYTKDDIYTGTIEPFFITHPEYEYYLFSTPRGKSGYFYEKVEHDDRWYSPHWPTRISPYAQQDFIDRKRAELDSQTFAQEYEGEFVEASDAYLPHGIVNPCIDHDPQRDSHAPRFLGVDPARKGDDRLVIYDIDADGHWHNIWAEEYTEGPQFVGQLTALQTGGAIPTPDIGTGRAPNGGYADIAIEDNAVGGYGADFAEANLGRVVTAVTSSNKSKQAFYQRLKNDLESGNITLPNNRRLIDELTSLQYSYTQTGLLKIAHPPGGHDDYPDALMLANAARTGLVSDFETGLDGTPQERLPPVW